MFSESLRSVRKVAHLIPTLKSSLVVEGCWQPYHPVQVNAAELMGETKIHISNSFVFFFCCILFCYVTKLHLNRYILEGKELEFYMKKIQRKKGKGASAA